MTIQQKIFWFNISMANSLFMTIFYSVSDRFDSFSGLKLRELLFLTNHDEEFSTLHQFHDEAPVTLVLIDVDQFDDVRVINLF